MTDHRAEALRLLQEADDNPDALTLVAAAQVHAMLHASELQERMLSVSDELIAASQPPVAGVRDAARQTAGQQPSCVCGKPTSPGTRHRADGPCYVDEPAVGQQPTQQPTTERATVLREAADWFEEHCPNASGGLPLCMCHAADELRRLADGPAS